jgi:hypothetical protein
MGAYNYSVLFLFVLLLALIVPVSAQAPEPAILQSYERIFVRSSLRTKVNVLSDAAQDEAAGEFYGQFCDIALRFVLDNAPLFREDPDMLSLIVIAVRGIDNTAYNPAAETLWQVFLRFPDRAVRHEILKALHSLDASSLTGKINGFLAAQNSSRTAGFADHAFLFDLIALLGRAGDDSSYPVLFDSNLIHTGDLRANAIRAIYAIDGDLIAFCIEVILNNPPEEKLEAVKLGLARGGLSTEEKGALAEAALEAALAVPGDRRNEIQELAGVAVNLIREIEWIRALPQVINYYNQSLAVFRAAPSRKQPVLNAIYCLGFLKNAEAASSLAIQLGLFNSRAGKLQAEEHEVVLAHINALARLGYKASYSVIHHASILPYPGEITDAARNALTALQW